MQLQEHSFLLSPITYMENLHDWISSGCALVSLGISLFTLDKVNKIKKESNMSTGDMTNSRPVNQTLHGGSNNTQVGGDQYNGR